MFNIANKNNKIHLLIKQGFESPNEHKTNPRPIKYKKYQ